MEKKMIAIQNQVDLRAEIEGEGEEPKKKIIRGYPILYDSPAKIGSWTEYVRKGALDGVDLSDLMLLSYHNTAMPLALNDINLRTAVDDKGLFIEAELPNTSNANDVYELVRLGILSGMSYWFNASEVKENTETKTVEILKFAWIKEVSIVTFPAYPETLVITYEPQQRNPKLVKKMLL